MNPHAETSPFPAGEALTVGAPFDPAAAPASAVILDAADGGLAVARALRRRGVPVTLISVPSYRWVTRARGVDGRIADTDDEWIGALGEVASQGPGVLLPASDRAVEFISQKRDLIPPALRSFEGPTSAHLKLMDKASLYSLAAEAGVRAPVVERIGSRSEVDAAAARAAYPSLLKPVLSHVYRELFGSNRNILVHDPDELREAAGPALDAGLEWLVTEFVPGSELNLEGAVTVRLADGSLALGYTRRKLRQHPPYFGAGSVLETFPAPEVMTLTLRLLEAAGFVGICSLEAKRHADTGEHVLMEVNVRIPQNIGLGEAAGVEASWRIYATLAGIPLPPQRPQRNGVRVVVPSLEVRAAPAYIRKGDLTVRDVLGSYRTVRNVSGLSLSDPGPLLSFLGDLATTGVRFIGRRLRGLVGSIFRGRGAGDTGGAGGSTGGNAASGAGRPSAKSVAKSVLPAGLRPAAKRLYYRALGPGGRRAQMAEHLRGAAAAARRMGSPLYATLLEHSADDVQAQGPCWRLLADRPPSEVGQTDPLSVRLMGSVHRLVLEGEAPDLAPFYPSAGGTDHGDPWPAFAGVVEAHRERLVGLLDRPVQTNEVSRCTALLTGFLTVARETGLPLRLLELGSSAGLLLRWPEYHYVEGDLTWGDPRSPVRLEGAYAAGRPPFEVPATVAERRACDAAPLDPTSAEDRLTLMSFVWADETWRFELLRAALEVAQRVPVTVEQADACDWLETMLAEPAPDVATVVFHSLFIHFLDEQGRARLETALEAAGRRASTSAPLAWLSLEWDGGDKPELRLTTWPGTTRKLADTDDRGREIRLAPGI
jgi:predicted ATP-grasp superfamily ATP-dependent carboligase